MKRYGVKKDAEKTTARVHGFRYKVVKNGVVLGGHDVRASAQKLADQMGGEVVDTKVAK
jgi:aspartyl-tRNA synthetase